MTTAPDALAQLASTGIAGVVAVLAILALRQKDKELRAESAERIADSKMFATVLMDLQAKVTGAVIVMADLAEKWEKREEERERAAREAALRVPTPPPFRPAAKR